MPRLHGYRERRSFGDLLDEVAAEIRRLVDREGVPYGATIVPLRGEEPPAPRDWPTAIVTRWSGKR